MSQQGEAEAGERAKLTKELEIAQGRTRLLEEQGILVSRNMEFYNI